MGLREKLKAGAKLEDFAVQRPSPLARPHQRNQRSGARQDAELQPMGPTFACSSVALRNVPCHFDGLEN